MSDTLHWQRDDARAKFDAAGFAAALDATRATRGATWRQVATEAKVSPSTLTRLGAGYRPDMDGFAALADWLDSYVHLRLAIFASNTPGRFGRGWAGRHDAVWLSRLGVHLSERTRRVTAYASW